MKRPPGEKPVKLVRKRLDDIGLRAHFDWLAAEASAVEIRIKGKPTAHSDVATDSLDEVSRRLQAGELVAVQIWYVHDGAWWCDTVMRAGDSFRLVRMRQEESPPP